MTRMSPPTPPRVPAGTKVDGVDVLSKVSGLSRAAVNQIWEEVKANQAKLTACPGPHDFRPVGKKKVGDDYVCAVCGGKVRSIDKHWFDIGRNHERIATARKQGEKA